MKDYVGAGLWTTQEVQQRCFIADVEITKEEHSSRLRQIIVSAENIPETYEKVLEYLKK